MKRIITTMAIIAATIFSVSAQKSITNVSCNADKVVKWWNNDKAPHSNEETEDEIFEKGNFKKTSQTEFYLYIADKETATGQAVVICPGGGYGAVCIEREGFKLAEYFKSIGVTALALKYRLPNNGHKEVPLEDAQAALSYLRKNAKEVGHRPSKGWYCRFFCWWTLGGIHIDLHSGRGEAGILGVVLPCNHKSGGCHPS